MKVRTDYVTNSSSSSFIIARKEELSQQQKEIIVDFVIKKMLGEKIISNEKELNQYIEERMEDYGYIDEKVKQGMQESIKNGLSIFSGWVSFEGSGQIAYLLNDLWEAIEKADSSSFIGIDTSLDY